LLYVGSHAEIGSNGDRCKKLALAPVYAVGQQLKLISGIDRVHALFINLVGKTNEPLALLTAENCFKVQTLVELLF